MKAQRVIAVARSFVGVPYRHQGYSRQGVDCWGLVRLTCETLDIVPPDFVPSASYGRLPNGVLLASVAKHCVSIDTLELACIVLMCWPGNRSPMHMALVNQREGRPYLIHANSDHGKVVEHGYQHPWTLFQHSLWRLPGVEQ